MKKKIIIPAVIAAVVVIGAVTVKVFLTENTKDSPQNTVSAVDVTRGSLRQTIKLSAVLEGTDSTEVSSNLHYEVEQLLVKEGDRVTKGQLLAVVDSSELSRKVQSSNGSVKLIETQNSETLKDRQISYDKAKLALDNAQKNYNDKKTLYDAGAVSEQELSEAKDNLEIAKRELEAIPNENGKAVLSESEKQSLANSRLDASIQAQILDDCKITSPIDGTVTRVNTKVGRFADGGENKEPMFVIENIDRLGMEVQVGESDIGNVKVGQRVEVTADILNGDIVSGVVERISPTGEEKSGGMGGRVIPVYISLDEDCGGLIAGITAKATILVAEEDNALIVPIEAVAENENGEDIVYTVNDDGAIHIVTVKIGAEDDLNCVITGEGIDEGTKVVLSPSPELTEGTKVLIQ